MKHNDEIPESTKNQLRLIAFSDFDAYWNGVIALKHWHAEANEIKKRRAKKARAENVKWCARHQDAIRRAAEHSLSPLSWARANADRVRAMLATQAKQEGGES